VRLVLLPVSVRCVRWQGVGAGLPYPFRPGGTGPLCFLVDLLYEVVRIVRG